MKNIIRPFNNLIGCGSGLTIAKHTCILSDDQKSQRELGVDYNTITHADDDDENS